MATKPVKKIPLLDVGYSDKTGVVTVTLPADDSEVATLSVREFIGQTVPEGAVKACIRYFAGGARDAVAAVQKAGKPLADAIDAVEKFFAAVLAGTLQFRERGGEGSLSVEDEFEVIVGVMLTLGIMPTKEECEEWLKAKYAVTKEVRTPAKPAEGVEGQPGYKKATPEKVSITHPEYNAVKKIKDVAAALADANKVDSVSEFQALGAKKKAA